MPHICPDEINAFIAAVPFIRDIVFQAEVLVLKLRALL
jgi:hypothetical protein